MIPKIIHYIWLGDSSYSEEILECINTWKHKMPEYEIKLWNESNFDFSICLYAKEAIQEKKYAFASDYVRLWVLYNYGGIYLDTDVEVLKNFNDLLTYKAFAGFEDRDRVATCILGSEKGNPLFKEFLDDYNDRCFILGDGQYDTTPNPVPITKRLLKHGLKLDGSYQKLDMITLFPIDYFCPFNPYRQGADVFTENTYINHRFNGAWKNTSNENEKRYFEKEIKYKKIFGNKIGAKICKHVSIIQYIGFKNWCKRYLSK